MKALSYESAFLAKMKTEARDGFIKLFYTL